MHSVKARVTAAVAAATLVGLAACNNDDTLAPRPMRAPELSVYYQLSSLSAPVGREVAVGVAAATTGEPLGALQGYVRFDPSALEFVGQVPEGSRSYVIVNDGEADRGAIRMVAVDPHGLSTRAATFVFRVKRADYATTLDYELEEAAFRDVAVNSARILSPRVADVPVTGARRMTMDDWGTLVYGDEYRRDMERAGSVRGPSLSVGRPLLTPGQYRENLIYGDANLSGAISGADGVYIASVSVGNIPLTDATSRDAVVAGNVFPFNAPGLGEPGDSLRPGALLSGGKVVAGEITGSDALQINLENVSIDRPVVGLLIPGRNIPPSSSRPRVPITAGYLPASRTFHKDTVYELQGVVRVDSGRTLTIQPGTQIEGSSLVTPSALFIHRDGQIVADGTPLEPIVFTCTATTKAKGCWGGLVVSGYAPINFSSIASPGNLGPCARGETTGSCLQNQGEGGAPIYGGGTPTDSSGVIRYVRVEYAGFELNANNELNGLTLNGVGNRTVVDYVQIHAGKDDGIEFFGGTVNVSHLYLTANSDDTFDMSDGWVGNAQFVIAQQDSLDADHGIEADNVNITGGTTAQYSALPLTAPKLYNFTFVGRRTPSATSGVSGNNVDIAFQLRRGTRPEIRNFIVANYRTGLDIDDVESTCSTLGTSLLASHGIWIGNNSLGSSDAETKSEADATVMNCGSYASPNAERDYLNDAATSNRVITTPDSVLQVLRAPFDYLGPDFRPRNGLSSALFPAGVTPPAGFDASATYRGAVPEASSTGNNIPWYMGWTRSFASATAP